VYPDGRQLASLDPNAGPPRLALRGNPELRSGSDHRLFQRPHVPHDVAPDGAQVQNRISHKLSWPVVGNVSTAIGGMELHAFLPQHMLGGQQIFQLAVSPQGNHMRMLAKQKHILDCTGFPRRHNALLQRVSLRIAKQSQVDGQEFIQHRPSFFVGAQHAAPLQARCQTLICNPRTEAKASPSASHTVGCACIMFIMSSMVPSRFNTVAASARSSVASGPMM